ncbi:hypothetical protein QBC47DRAFT_310091 [Echria macrotheca]|uniref:Low temperature requirement A n=1 Tax=Echria macrotheca TaxID=438768 RepID=A0AAJ0B438_9PEZI|nr:hypothetical protein QBC47DRAFT_310091 [Echria macrotheca]
MSSHSLPAHEGKLPLIVSPLVEKTQSQSLERVDERQPAEPNLTDLGFREGPNYDGPEFERHREATAIEVFYDLFFAANLTVFSESQDITNMEKVTTFIAYFSLLWFNWALLGLYDVRFVTDSVFERCARGVHFGVMVSFAVIAPNFNLGSQKPATFQTLSIILMTSRLVLAIQYATIWWHIRRYKNTKAPLGVMVGANFVAAMVYLGIGFGFYGGSTSLFATWFIITAIEAAIAVGVSYVWKVLSFSGTHLANRVTLLTFILMGEGVVSVCVSVVRIVSNANSWTSATIGNVTAGIANVYVIFMIYHDWSHNLFLGKVKLVIWSFLHYPFHLAMRLFIEGSSQFVIWWKIFETMYFVGDKLTTSLAALNDPNSEDNLTIEWFVGVLNDTATDIFNTYVPIYVNTGDAIDQALSDLLEVPDMNITEQAKSDKIDRLLEVYSKAIENSLFTTFKIDGFASHLNDTSLDTFALEDKVNDQNWGKANLVFNYAYIAAGITLILMNTLFIVKGPSVRRWTFFNWVRKSVNYLTGIALVLVSAARLDKNGETFEGTPWPLPTLLLVFFAILVLNHLPAPPPLLFRSKDAPDAAKTEGWTAVQEMGWRTKRVEDEASSANGSQNKTAHQSVDVTEDTTHQGVRG